MAKSAYILLIMSTMKNGGNSKVVIYMDGGNSNDEEFGEPETKMASTGEGGSKKEKKSNFRGKIQNHICFHPFIHRPLLLKQGDIPVPVPIPPPTDTVSLMHPKSRRDSV